MPRLLYVSAQMGGPYEIDGPSIFTQRALPLRSNRWSYEIFPNALSSIRRVARETECSMHFTDSAAFDAATQAFDADMQAGTPGTLVADGDWEQRAYIVGWSAEEVFENGISGKATVVLLDGVWRRTTTVTLKRRSASPHTIDGIDLGSPPNDDGIDLGYDFPGLPGGPVITVHPQSISIGQTERALFQVDAIGYHLSYQWQVLSGSSWVNLKDVTARTSILVLGMGMSGSYRCVVTDVFERSATSAVAVLTVYASEDDYESDFPADFEMNVAPPYDTDIGITTRRKESWPSPGDDTSDSAGFDVGIDIVGAKVVVENQNGALLRVRFNGPCNSPYVVVAGNTYKVNAQAVNGETIVIDPLRRNSCKVGEIVYRVDRYGYTTNLYSSRERGHEGSGSYVFQRVPYGEHYVSWPQDMTVDLDIIDERGMPPWSS